MMANFGKAAGNIAGGAASGSVIGDPDPFADKCSAATRAQIQMTGGGNVGELLSAKGITWGSFMGGFADCTAAHGGITGLPPTTDYIPHHAFFQYWQKTLNANHLPPSSVATIGTDADQANHEYDLAPFWNAIAAGHMPAVAYIKAPAFEDGHAGYSDPLDEQNFLVTFINKLQQTKEWRETAVFIAYDDSDGWYDHVMGPIVTQSNVADDALLGPGNCGTAKAEDGLVENGKCGLGPRFPFLVISPYARRNYVDHKTTELASIVRFIEDNWNLGRIGVGSRDEDAGTLNGMFDFGDRPRAPKLIMNPLTGQILKADHDEN
jgi:phospholipase C